MKEEGGGWENRGRIGEKGMLGSLVWNVSRSFSSKAHIHTACSPPPPKKSY